VGSFETTVSQVRETIANEMIGAKLQTVAEETVAPVDTYIVERIQDIQEWAATPVIISALQEGIQEAEGLASRGLDIDQIEELVEDNHELLPESQAKIFC
jgi:hypothetical protein